MQPSRLFAATCRLEGAPDRVPSVVGARKPPEGLIQKACLQNVEAYTFLALHKRHCTLFPGHREADVSSLGGAKFLLTEVAAEVLAVVNRKNSGEFGLDQQLARIDQMMLQVVTHHLNPYAWQFMYWLNMEGQ